MYAAMQGGKGALLFYAGNYEGASDALLDDSNDMFSMALLVRCYGRLNGKSAAEVLQKSIVEVHNMDIDLALVQREIKDRSSDSEP